MFEVLEPFYVKVVDHPNVVYTILYSASNH